jgi:hypothetical protein
MSGESLVLVRNRATRIVMIGEPQEHDFGPGSDPAKRSGHALRVDERAKAPVQIDHAIVGGRLLWFATSQAEQLVAQRGKGVSRIQTTMSNLLAVTAIVPKETESMQMMERGLPEAQL